MTQNTLANYGPLLLHFLIAIALGSVIVIASAIVGWRRPSRIKESPYECGVEPVGDARHPVPVKFYLVAMVFILFDVEAIFLYPWAYVYRQLRWFGFVEMLTYIAILLAGYFYLWKKGALDWNRSAARGNRGS
jgi:NADH-quinone oxidoreductase subunit A